MSVKSLNFSETGPLSQKTSLPPQMLAVLRLLERKGDGPIDPLSDPATLLALEAYFGQETLTSTLHLLETPTASSMKASSPDRSSPSMAGRVPVVQFRLRNRGGNTEGQESFLSIRGSRGLPYTVLLGATPPYCACATWRHGLVASTLCKHVVAGAIAVTTGTFAVRDIDDRAKFVERMISGTKGH